MNKKVLFIGGGALAVIAIVVALIFIFTGGSDEYRSIKVFEMDGKCTVTRGNDTLDAFKNMALSSGDTFEVPGTGFARLKLDEDKFVYLEAGTKIELFATGTEKDSKTRVFIERGSMLTEVKRKLSATSSYDIVTPNTTMSIRGTKTLTEVYQDVLGAIKTSAAVVEGQVVFKTIQKDSTGKAVTVSTELGVGQGLGVTTDSKDLLSMDDVKHIADDGKTVDGQDVKETTHEELGTNLEAPVFSEEFLTNIVAVLARSREEDVEEGFAAENVTEEELNAAINVLNDVIDGKVELPVPVEEYIISQSSAYYDETIVSDNTVSGGEPDAGSDQSTADGGLTDDTVIPGESDNGGDDTLAADGTGNDTETVNGEESLINADDLDIAEEDDDEADGADVGDEADKSDEADEDEAAEDDDDETDETGEDDSDDADDSDKSDDEDKSDDNKSDKDDGSDVENEDKDDESDENGEVTPAPSQEPSQEPSQGSPSETETETEPATSDDDNPSQQGSSTSEQEQTTTNGLSYTNTTWNITYDPGPGSQSTTVPVKLVFVNTTSGGSSQNDLIYVDSLPRTFSSNNAVLPGCSGSSYIATVIPAETVDPASSGSADYSSISSMYSFTGWYASSADAEENDFSKRVTTYSGGNVTLYPGICKTSMVMFIGNSTDPGHVVLPSLATSDVISYNVEDGTPYMIVKEGSTITLPMVESVSSTATVDHPYIQMDSDLSEDTSFFCYSTGSISDLTELWFDGTKPSTYDNKNIYYASQTPQTVTVDDSVLLLHLNFVTSVEVRVFEKTGDRLNVKDPNASWGTDPVLLSELNSTMNGTPGVLPGGQSYSKKWKLEATERSGGTLYTLSTVHSGYTVYAPKIGCADSSTSQTTYQKELLCSYRDSKTGLITTYDGTSPYSTYIQKQTSGGINNVLSIQLVDWVYIDMSGNSAPSGVSKLFKVGENNPYVIPYSDSSSTEKYKFAVSPVDLYNLSGQPAAPFNFTAQGDGANSIDRFIYSPDDILYPIIKAGTLRNESYGTDPSAIYNSSAFSDTLKKSYSYIGVTGYRLIGYKIGWTYMNSSTGGFDFIFNEMDGQQSGSYVYGAYSCTVNGTNDSVANKLNLAVLQPYIGSSGWDSITASGITLTPMFVQSGAVTAELIYTAKDSDYDSVRGAYKALDSVIGNYTLKLSGVEAESARQIGIDLSPIRLTYFGTSSIESHVKSTIRVSGSEWRAVISNETYNTLTGGDFEYDESNKVLSLNLSKLYVYDTEVTGTNAVSATSKCVPFGIEGTSDTAYRPSKVKINVPVSEALKYSCFVYNRYGKQIARVFTAGSLFNKSANSNFHNPVMNGFISDMAGANNLGYAYYGGKILVDSLVGKNQSGEYTSVDGATRTGMTKEVKRTALTLAENTEILPFVLGENYQDYQGYVGMFRLESYNSINVNNCSTDQCVFDALLNQSGNLDTNTFKRLVSVPLNQSSQFEGLLTINRRFPGGNDQNSRIFGVTDKVNDVPDGFVYLETVTQSGTYSGLVYVGNDSSVKVQYENNGNQAELTAVEHTADLTFALG